MELAFAEIIQNLRTDDPKILRCGYGKELAVERAELNLHEQDVFVSFCNRHSHKETRRNKNIFTANP